MSVVTQTKRQQQVEGPSPQIEPVVPAHPAPTGHYFARFGSFLVTVPETIEDPTPLRDRLYAALKADTRVAGISADPLRVPWTIQSRMYPPSTQTSTAELLTGSDSFVNVRLSDPLYFQVHVPIKNQPLFHGEDDVPSDDYWVVWDGTTAIALWESKAEAFYPTRSGGQIVVDILSDACAASDAGFVIQACSPGCENLFAHRVLRVTQFPDADEHIMYRLQGFPVVQTHLHADGGPAEVVSALFEDLKLPGGAFADYKNVARRILNIESRSRALVGELLILDYEETAAKSRNVFWRAGRAIGSGVAGLFGRSDRLRAQELISSLWLAMAAIETIRRDWNANRREFLDVSDGRGRREIFSEDRAEDDAAMKLMDLGFIRAAVKQKSNRIDSRVIVIATVLGAVAVAAGTLLAALVHPASGN